MNLEDCFVSDEQIKSKLEAVEIKLSNRFAILKSFHEFIRKELFAIDRANKLIEDELVADWHDLICWNNVSIRI